jgi:hypothetical protein
MSIYLCASYVCTRGVDTSSEGWSIDVLLTTVWVLFTSVIIVSVCAMGLLVRVCASSSLWISRDSQICVEQRIYIKKMREVKQSDRDFLFSLSLFLPTVTNHGLESRRRIGYFCCRQDMKIKIKEWQSSCRYLFYFIFSSSSKMIPLRIQKRMSMHILKLPSIVVNILNWYQSPQKKILLMTL